MPRPWAIALLALVLGVTPTGDAVAIAEPSGDGTDQALQAEMERLFALRTQDPQAFVARTRSLESRPPPANVAQREYLQLLSAYRVALEGRFADAITLAKPLGESSEDPGLRLMGATFVVNLRAGTREFETGLRELSRLLHAHPSAEGALHAEVLGLWTVASTFYGELGKPELARWYAQRVLENHPDPRSACHAEHFIVWARREAGDAALDSADFDRVEQRCDEAGERSVFTGFLTLNELRFLHQRQRFDDALALMEARLGIIESTRYPRLVAEAYALDAETLLATNRLTAAERQARHAIEVARDTPTSLPVAIAEKVLYEVHRRRGQTGAALQHLQRHLAADRALIEEDRIKALAFGRVQHEILQREQALRLATARGEVLDLEARVAKAESRNALLAAGVLLLALLLLGAWGWRLRRDARRLRTIARTDALTGLATRQHFAEQAEAVLARCRKRGRPAGLLVFDLDHFKRINDTHGHLAGDALLRAIGETLRGLPLGAPARLMGRVGGEEFAVLLDDAGAAETLAYAEALRAAVAGARSRSDAGVELAVTASVGITSTRDCGHDLRTLMATGDRALYLAKGGGRDRVIAAGPDGTRQAA